MQGWLHRSGTGQGDRDDLPTVAVVASYDSFAAAPVRLRGAFRWAALTHSIAQELAFSVDQSGSGTVAVLALARIFARLYSDFRTHGV